MIEARRVEKYFPIPGERQTTLKERVLHPDAWLRPQGRTLEALRDVSFEVGRGEFFGVVGRNGSGKSTLLKLLASIYRLDGGSIRVAGRLAPFIELGVGFNAELTAYDNVVLNGVMMGHSPTEARARYDAVIEYAELGDYTDLKLKNYSSGMHVRLAFSLMLQADADILLVDEVLAVGDVAFQEKCIQSLEELKRNGVTIVLVTHDMNAIQSHCDRAMLIEDGVVDALGEAGAVASRYLELLFPIEDEAAALHGGAGGANFTDAWLSGANGDRVEKVGPGDSVTVNLKLQAREDISGLQALVELINNPEGLVIATFPVGYGAGEPLAVAAGEELTIRVSLERAPLAAGTYRFLYHLGTADRLFDRARSPLTLRVQGPGSSGGVVELAHTVAVEHDSAERRE